MKEPCACKALFAYYVNNKLQIDGCANLVEV